MGEKSAAPVTRGGSIEISEKDLPRTTLGAGVGVGVSARRPDRGSRAVSFADSVHPRPSTGSGPRPSIGSRPYSRGSGAFHTASYAGADEDEAGAAPPVPALPSPSRAGAFGAIERISSTGTGAANTTSVYQNGAAWTSGERVEGVDGGYGARSVSPTGRVHTVNYPATMVHREPESERDEQRGRERHGEPAADWGPADVHAGGHPPPHDGAARERPGELAPERRRGVWRAEHDAHRRAHADAADNEVDDAGEYLFAPQQAVFQYPGTPAPGSAFSSPAIPASPFAMPMQPPTMSPDDMLRAYAAKHASTASSTPSPLARAEVVASLKDTGMRVLYKPEDESSAAAGARAASPVLIRAGPGARVSR